MKLHIAILAACAAILTVTPALARDGDPIPGVDYKLKAKNQAVEKGSRTTPANTPAGQRPKLNDSESPRPQNR